MASFRLKMATQLGEKTASENGYHKFPIDPLALARSKEIQVQAKPPGVPGISGALIFAADSVSLIYSTEYNNVGFQNFSVAHELGHYFMPGHPEEIRKQGGTHLSRADFTQSSSIELEADHFASGLLMPAKLTRNLLTEHKPGLEGIIALAEEAHCSRTAAAIRAAECCSYPIAVIVSEQDKISYAFLSESFKSLGKLAFLKKGSALPACVTLTFNAERQNVLSAKQAHEQTNLRTWFDGPDGIPLDEEVVGLGHYGYTLTVLSSERLKGEPDDDENEDAELEESWTARFAYGR